MNELAVGDSLFLCRQTSLVAYDHLRFLGLVWYCPLISTADFNFAESVLDYTSFVLAPFISSTQRQEQLDEIAVVSVVEPENRTANFGIITYFPLFSTSGLNILLSYQLH
jgi:hypothetical protein